jgi:hypothetical protein
MCDMACRRYELNPLRWWFSQPKHDNMMIDNVLFFISFSLPVLGPNEDSHYITDLLFLPIQLFWFQSLIHIKSWMCSPQSTPSAAIGTSLTIGWATWSSRYRYISQQYNQHEACWLHTYEWSISPTTYTCQNINPWACRCPNAGAIPTRLINGHDSRLR